MSRPTTKDISARSRAGETLARFAAVGALTTLLDMSLFNTLYYVGLPPLPSNLVSYSCGIAVSYMLNRAWTFRAAHSHVQAVKFVVATVTGLLISTIIVATLALLIPAPVAKLVSVPIVFVWNYLTSRLWVFRQTAEADAMLK
ncbi:MAG TPA: GtrA family protein [Ensifer sp.]|jgi:putative flippase GtrA|uniref:GtrA family protein n=1 Tax=Ensifer sp. TaxID=1872086 RepID=UPI002E0E42F3|nr:GtrA family protein [Ensifer sp.]